jgi:hypothetical protein
MKKFVSAILFLSLVISFGLMSIVSSATDTEEYTYQYDHITICFDEHTALSAEMRQMIAEKLLNGSEFETDDGATTYSWCWLTGHNKQTDYAQKITHEYRSTSPRCLSETYEVVTCTKCDYYTEELIATTYLNCCP